MEQNLKNENHHITYFHVLNDLNFDRIKELKTNTQDSEFTNTLCPRLGVRILTYNIFLRPPPIKNNEDDYKNERLEDFCKVINDFDIICLQEMFGTYNSRKQVLIQHANKCGFFFYTDTLTPNMFSKHMIDAGLLILSRFPIVESCFYPFTYGVLSDNLAEKGILYAKIKIKDKFINIMTTHLQASYFDSTEFHFNVSFNTRMEQLQEVKKIVKEILNMYYTNENDLIILVGDFNVDANRYKYKKPTAVKNYEHLFEEYDNMMLYLCDEEIQFFDIFKKYKIPHQITYGEDENEEILTWVTDRGSKQCLDYMFEILYKTNNDSNIDLKLERKTIKIEKFFLKSYKCFQDVLKKRLYKQLSDHYGISIVLQLKDQIMAESHKKILKDFYEEYDDDYNSNCIMDEMDIEGELGLDNEPNKNVLDDNKDQLLDDDLKNLV